MTKYRAAVKTGAVIAAGTAMTMLTSAAWAAAQTPSITGDKWAAYGIIGGLVVVILLFVFASVGMARRDAAYEKGHRHHNEVPGFPMLGDEEDGQDDD